MLPQADLLVREYDMLPPGVRVLCAVSGGADSMCLLHWLSRRKDITLVAAHFNHQLRGEESDRDARFVRDWCAENHIPFHLGTGDVEGRAEQLGQGIEETARQMRYAFLSETAQAIGADAVATAHNADDNAETLLLNLIRGTGLKGLGGISPQRGNLIRPLLTTTREEVEAYLKRYHIPHVEDSSNQNEDFSRNKVRRQLVPLLQDLNPKAVEHINVAAAQAREVDDYLDRQAKVAFTGLGTGPGWVSLPWEDLRQAPPPLRPRLLQLLLDRMEVGRKDFGAVHFDAVLSLENERSIDLPHGVTARRERGRLFLSRRLVLPAQTALRNGSPFQWGDYTLTLSDRPGEEGLALWVPEGAELAVGPCPAGERLTLPGSKGARTIKRLCLDKGISLAEREGLPAIYVNRRLAAVWRLGVDLEFSPGSSKDFYRFIQIQKG